MGAAPSRPVGELVAASPPRPAGRLVHVAQSELAGGLVGAAPSRPAGRLRSRPTGGLWWAGLAGELAEALHAPDWQALLLQGLCASSALWC